MDDHNQQNPRRYESRPSVYKPMQPPEESTHPHDPNAANYNYHPNQMGMSQPPYTNPGELKHSGPGIASTIIAIGAFILFIIAFATMFQIINGLLSVDELNNLIGSNNLQGADPEHLANILTENANPIVIILAGFGTLGAILLTIIALVLGIIGLVQNNRKKAFAVTGTVISGLILGFGVLIFMIGMVSI